MNLPQGSLIAGTNLRFCSMIGTFTKSHSSNQNGHHEELQLNGNEDAFPLQRSLIQEPPQFRTYPHLQKKVGCNASTKTNPQSAVRPAHK